MRKITLIASFVGLCTMAFAQQAITTTKYSFAQQRYDAKPYVAKSNETVNGKHSNARTSATVFYTQDFSAGIPNTWVTTNTGSPIDWRITHNPKVSAFSSTLNFKSSTVGNGFMILAYDSAANVAGNPSPYPKYHCTIATNNIDCSTHTNVTLRFQHLFRALNQGTPGTALANDEFRFEVSNDGGTTWMQYGVMHGLNPQVVSANPTKEAINISDIAAGKSQVKLRWTYDGDYYFWAVDDITMEESTTDDIAVEKYYNYFGVPNTPAYIESFYRCVPALQMPDTMRLGAAVYNAGAHDQTVQVKGTIYKGSIGGTIIDSQTKSPGKLLKALGTGVTADQARDTQYVNLRMSLKDTGNYYTYITTTLTPGTDVDSTNNTKAVRFSITDSVYARDNDSARLALSINSSSFTGANKDGFQIINLYDVAKKDTAVGISLFLQKGSLVGSSFDVRLYLDANLASGTPTAQSSAYTITAADSVAMKANGYGIWKTLPFQSNAELTPGSWWAAFYSYDLSTLGGYISIADDQVTPQETYATEIIIPGTGGGRYSNGNAAFIRLLTKYTHGTTGVASIKANKAFKLYQNVPNPFNGTTTINYTLANAVNKVTVEIHDITGKKLMEINNGSQLAGDYSFNVDASKLGKGVYFYTLRAGDYTETLRMVVTE